MPDQQTRTRNHAAIIVAGGSGSRMGSTLPKQMLELQGIPILHHVLAAFQQVALIDCIVCVLEKDILLRAIELGIGPARYGKIRHMVPGGKTRTESVWNGLSVLERVEIVLIHDGVRPLISPELITRAIEAARTFDAAVPAVELTDTLKEVDPDGWIVSTCHRQNYRCVQTPQAFRFDLIKQAYRHCMDEQINLTDDAAVVERFGHKVHIFNGDPTNIKITFRRDLDLADYLFGKGKEERCSE
ncbi:2-C-methyl-D-erythritol 4-phosphate cytidylyltransferase [bacterium]|nr:2-C-methyl-D-erythritol 4-phosphate cytidylyltransferase [bacterium]